jgi:hypothetical protein
VAESSTAPASTLRLFKRSVEVTLISQPTPAPLDSKDPGYFKRDDPNAIIISDLRVQFEVKKDVGRNPNSCVLTITNLSRDTRTRLERKPVYAIVRAGHDGVLRPLFEGSVMYAESSLKSPDWETKLRISDGGRAFSQAHMSRSYTPPIRVDQVLTDAAASMGLPLPPDLAAATELKQALAGGFTAHAPVRDILTRMLAPYNYSWSIQSGRLQIVKDGAPNANSAWEINVDAGMIGSPEASVPSKPGAPSELTVDVLLFPEIVPGDTVQVTSRAIAGGLFRVNDVNHKGDTHGNDWTTSLKSTPLGVPPPRGRGRR